MAPPLKVRKERLVFGGLKELLKHKGWHPVVWMPPLGLRGEVDEEYPLGG
jgi:hypothetical protein